MIVLPTRTDQTFYDFETELDGTTFRVELKWNTRDQAWYFTLYDAAGATLVASRRVVVGMPLRARFVSAGMPAGDFLAVDTSGKDIDPGLTDLGARVLLVYQELGDA